MGYLWATNHKHIIPELSQLVSLDGLSMSHPLSFDGLPMELRVALLQQMPDIVSLRAIIRSSSILFRTFQSRQFAILHDIFSHQIDHGLSPELKLAWRSSSINSENN